MPNKYILKLYSNTKNIFTQDSRFKFKPMHSLCIFECFWKFTTPGNCSSVMVTSYIIFFSNFLAWKV